VKRRFRLTRSSDIKRVRRLGKSYAHPLIVLVVFPNELPAARFGIIAGRSVGGAVQRNRSKRILRAIVHPLLAIIAPGWDIILLARLPMRKASFVETQGALIGLLRRAHLMKISNVST
jgi:ribonuclease P protein component